MEDVGVAGPPCRLQLYPDSTQQARASEKPAQTPRVGGSPGLPGTASKEALPRCCQNADYVSFMIYPGFHPLESLAAREGRVEDVDAARKRCGGREGHGGPRRSAGNIGITVVW